MFQILDGREHFYQWDVDRKIIVLDDDVKEVHFCNHADDCSLVCEVYSIDDIRLVNVPNILLQEDLRINVYAYDGTYTKHSRYFKVMRRAKPLDYVYTETEIKRYGDLEERIAALEEGNVDIDLEGYATEEYVNDAISTIELTPGPKGDSGVYVGTEEPADESVNVWINPEENDVIYPSGGGGGSVDLTGYATEEYVDNAIANIDIPTVDLTGYATEQYVDDAIANIDIPTGSGGGNANICNFTTTSEQEVNGITVELPTTLNKFYIVEFSIVFGEVLTEKMALYSRQGGGSFHGYGTSLPENTKAATVFGLRFSDEFLHIGFNSAITYEVNAFARFPSEPLRISQTEKTITFFSNTSGVNFPTGTSISVWGVYEK